MNNVQIRWFLVGSLALVLGACEVSVGKCDKDDAGECVDLFDDEDGGEEDAGDVWDDAGLDGGGRADGGAGDGGGSDAKVDAAAGDGGGGRSDAAAEELTLEEFCEAQLAKAVAWRDAIGEYCDDDSFAELDTFLTLTFAFSADDAVGACITRFGSSKITFEPTRAAACAEAFANQFPEPPAMFPDDGIDLSKYTSTIGHGAATHVQLPACRTAFKGTVARDAVCADSLECQDGLRCLGAPGDTRKCQEELTGGVCLRTSDCADGHTCVGSDASGGKTCIASDDLPLTGNCQFSVECAEGKICNTSGKCVEPASDVICGP